jgi:hypothetical protein
MFSPHPSRISSDELRSGLPFFDHGSLLSLRQKDASPSRNSSARPTVYGLRLLEAANCFNSTSIGIAEGLKHWPSLTYLDLSRTVTARDVRVLSALHDLPGLQILKLRGIGLRDEDVGLVATKLGLRLRSLDIRDNRITDESVFHLRRKCMLESRDANDILRRNMSQSRGITPSMHDYLGFEISEKYKTEAQDEHVYKLLTTGFSAHVALEDTIGTGLTHLYISGNHISVKAAAILLRPRRLHVLDIGQLDSNMREQPALGPHSASWQIQSGVETLLPLLQQNSLNLSMLRLHHGIVTKLVDPQTQSSFIAELPGIVPGSDSISPIPSPPPGILELEGDSTPAIELPSETVIFEMEGSPATSVSEKRAEVGKPVGQDITERANFRRVDPPDHLTVPTPLSPLLSSPLLSPQALVSPLQLTPRSSSFPGSWQPLSDAPPTRKRTYSSILSDYEARQNYRMSQPHGLLPHMLPKLWTLILTGIPTHTLTNDIPQNIISFIRSCSEEANWAKLHSKVSYSLPPGQDRVSAEKSFASSFFGLKTIVLEMTSAESGLNMRPFSPTKGLSLAEDPDCEGLWAAASEDFSFFGSTEEECGQLEVGLAERIPMEARLGKMVVEGNTDASTPGNRPQSKGNHTEHPMIDVLAEISAFRKDRKVAFQLALNRGETSPYVEGYWDGSITVIKPSR